MRSYLVLGKGLPIRHVLRAHHQVGLRPLTDDSLLLRITGSSVNVDEDHTCYYVMGVRMSRSCVRLAVRIKLGWENFREDIGPARCSDELMVEFIYPVSVVHVEACKQS